MASLTSDGTVGSLAEDCRILAERVRAEIGPSIDTGDSATVDEIAAIVGGLESLSLELHNVLALRRRRETATFSPGDPIGAFADAFRDAVRRCESSERPPSKRSPPPETPEGDLQFSSTIFPLGEALLFLATQDKSGTVTLQVGDERIVMDLLGGAVVSGCSDSNPEGLRLGEILIAQGAVLERELEEFLQEHTGSGERLGDLLVARGLVSREQLLSALKHQLTQMFQRGLLAESAHFEFRARPIEPSVDGLSLLVSQCIMEGYEAIA